jgi:XTP/dITP diphosphohydrolase
MKVLIGTGNPAKYDRYKLVLQQFDGLESLSLKDVSKDILPIIEDGTTAEENARKKARIYAQATSLPTLSIDEALFIDGLPENQQPGVKVRRFDSDHPLTDDEMLEKFLQKTQHIPSTQRTVTWVYAICLVLTTGMEFFCEVHLKEMLSDQPKLPLIKGYPLSSLLYDPISKKFQSEYTQEDWLRYLEPVTNELQNIIQLALQH